MSLPTLIQRHKEARQRMDLYNRSSVTWAEDACANAGRATTELKEAIRAELNRLLPGIDIDELLEVLCDD